MMHKSYFTVEFVCQLCFAEQQTFTVFTVLLYIRVGWWSHSNSRGTTESKTLLLRYFAGQVSFKKPERRSQTIKPTTTFCSTDQS